MIIIAALHIEDAVSLNCQPSRWDIKINKQLLEAMNPAYNLSTIFLHSPLCPGREEKEIIVIEYEYAENSCFKSRQVMSQLQFKILDFSSIKEALVKLRIGITKR